MMLHEFSHNIQSFLLVHQHSQYVKREKRPSNPPPLALFHFQYSFIWNFLNHEGSAVTVGQVSWIGFRSRSREQPEPAQ